MQISSFFKGFGSQTEQVATVAVASSEKQSIYSDLILRWQSVVELNPSDKNARLQLLDVYSNASLWDEATCLAEELKSEFPDDYQVQVCYGRAVHKRGDLEAASAAWVELSNAFPEAVEPLIGLAKISISQDNVDAANSWADKALLIDQSDNSAKLIKAKLFQKKGEADAAISAYTQILQTEPSHYEAEINLSVMLLREERFDELLGRLKSSIEFHPAKPAFKMCLFRTHCKLQNYDEALETMETLLGQDVSKHEAEFYLEKADLLLKIGRNDEAESVCEAAIKRYPKNVKLLILYARVGQRKLNAA